MKKTLFLFFFGAFILMGHAQSYWNTAGKLLLKIEEVTLYTIEQQKLIEDLQKRLSEIENKKGGQQ